MAEITALADATGDVIYGELSKYLTGLFGKLDSLSGTCDIVSAIKAGVEAIDTTVCDVEGMLHGHAYIEMGDGLKWSPVNMGATRPEEYGDYYAWAETEPKTVFSWANYKYMEEGQASHLYINKYTFNDKFYKNAWWYSSEGVFLGDKRDGVEYRNLDSYGLEDDAARQNWRSTWRMPTLDEFKWLIENCTWLWTYDYEGTGVRGYIATSKVEGFTQNSLFFPAAGSLSNGYYTPDKETGRYWTATSGSNPVYGSYMYFYQDHQGLQDALTTGTGMIRYVGTPIRPVSE